MTLLSNAVIDLRLKFGMKAIEYAERTCIVVVEIMNRDNDVQIGIVVDTVSEVLNIKEDDVEDAPTFGSRFDTRFIRGMAKTGDNVKILLNIDEVLDLEERALLNEVV